MWIAICLGLALAAPGAWPQPPLEDPIRLSIRVEPPGAQVYVEVVNDGGSLQAIGRTNQPNLISRARFARSSLGIGFQIGGDRSRAHQGRIPNYRGYLPYRDTIPPAIYLKDTQKGLAPDGIFYWPTLGSDQAIRLKPAPGAGPWLERKVLWLQLHPHITLVLAFLAGAGLVLFVGVYLPRRHSWREERLKIQSFNERLRSLDVQNDLFLGRQFGEWATVRRLGAGGMAVVYKGVSMVTMNEDEAVAIKVMNVELAQDQEYRRRFDREVQISRSLDHANVVRMIDHGEQDGVLYLAMEFIEGQTLREIIPPRGYTLADGIPLGLGMIQGLLHAHSKGVVHRDLKPDNVMLTKSGLIKVMDLGLAKRKESENVTRTGDTFGTPAYMAPEQISGGALLPATDQYSLGVMLFELFTGRRPFEVAESLTLVMKHLQEPPPRIREYKSLLPQELDSMIDKMLAKDPAHRYRSLHEVQVELKKIQRTYCPS